MEGAVHATEKRLFLRYSSLTKVETTDSAEICLLINALEQKLVNILFAVVACVGRYKGQLSSNTDYYK